MEDAREPIAIVYEAADGCPGMSDFVAQIAALTAQIRMAAPGEKARRFEVRIARTEDGHHVGTLRVNGTDRRVSSREVDDAECAELVQALALITALTIDPKASTGAAAPIAPSAPAPAPSSVPKAAPPHPPTVPSTSLRARSIVARAPEPTSTPGGWRGALGGSFEAAVGLAPDLALGGGAHLDVAYPAGAPRWSLRAGFGYVTSGTIDAGPGDARFEAFLARIAGCASARPVAWVSLGPCANLETGALVGSGVAGSVIEEVSSASQPWFAPGISLRVGADVGGSLTLEVEGGPLFPVRRDEFVFEKPSAVVHHVPIVTGRAGLALGVQIW